MQNESSFDEIHDDPTEFTEFDFGSLDSIDQLVDELRSKKESVVPLFRELLKREDDSGRNAAVAALIAYIIDTNKPRQTAAVIAWCSGFSILQNQSAAGLAKHFGVSKQAWCAMANDICERLCISPPRAVRSELARESMSKSHFKKPKKQWTNS